ncbi:MAG: hypothetical protein ACHQRM_11855 [Bacteroidia bacterium]
MMLRKSFLFILLILAFQACKKDSSPTPASSSTHPNNSGTLFNGWFTPIANISWSHRSAGPVSYSAVTHLSITAQAFGPTASAHCGTILVNGTTLQFNTLINAYLDSTYTLNLSSQKNFQFISSVLPSFTYNVPDSFPVYPVSNAALISDTVVRANGLIIPLSNARLYDQVNCSLFDQSSGSNFVYKNGLTGINQLLFTPADLSVYSAGATISCKVLLIKNRTLTISGVNYTFGIQTAANYTLLVQ